MEGFDSLEGVDTKGIVAAPKKIDPKANAINEDVASQIADLTDGIDA